MEIEEALKVMMYDSLGDVTKESLRKHFIELMKKHHPDLYCHDSKLLAYNEKLAKQANEAHSVLQSLLKQLEAIKALEKLSKKEEVFAVIPFKSLIDIYAGKSIKLTSSDKRFELTKSNIRSHRVILLIECSIIYNGISYQFSKLKPVVMGDNYEIECTIPVIDMRDLDIKVKVYEKSVNIKLKNTETRLRLQFDNRVCLTVGIRKRAIKEDS